MQDMDHFNKSVQKSISITELKPFLFVNLYEKIAESHKSSHLRIWGVARGPKSSSANKWNQIAEGDVCLFVLDDNLIGYSRVHTKFQSEGIANQLWQAKGENSIRQYIFTLGDLMRFDNHSMSVAIKLWKRIKSKGLDLEVLEDANSVELLSSLYFPSGSDFLVNDLQGFESNSAKRKAIELHAVRIAMDFLKDMGYTEIQDVGSIYSFDLLANGPEGRLHVEVKGTTGKGDKVILTTNEVTFQKTCYPENALLIVSEIEISLKGELGATGGKLNFISPWEIDDARLVPISFEYSI